MGGFEEQKEVGGTRYSEVQEGVSAVKYRKIVVETSDERGKIFINWIRSQCGQRHVRTPLQCKLFVRCVIHGVPCLRHC